jgi:hypothetical protein
MKQSEKLDLVLRGLYEHKDDGLYWPISDFLKAIGFQPKFEELWRLAIRLRDDNYVQDPISDVQDVLCKITSYGIEYCEESSYTYVGKSIITNNYNISIGENKNLSVVSDSQNVSVAQSAPLADTQSPNPSDLSLAVILKSLTVPQLWAIVTSIIALIVGSFFFGYNLNRWVIGNGNNQHPSTTINQMDSFKIIKCFKESSEFQSEIGTEIVSAKDEIWFFGMNFHLSAVDQRPKLLDKLRSGVKIRYLVLDPYFPHLDQVARDFIQPPTELKNECLKGLNDIFELKRQWDLISNQTRSPGELEIRFYNNYPKSRLYLFDPGQSTGMTMFVPYFTSFRSPNMPGFLIENNPSSIFKSYYDGVRNLWNRSYGLNTFHNEHPDFPNVPL